MLLAFSLQVDNYCEGQRCEVLDRSACPRACQLFVRTSRPTTCKHQERGRQSRTSPDLFARLHLTFGLGVAWR